MKKGQLDKLETFRGSDSPFGDLRSMLKVSPVGKDLSSDSLEIQCEGTHKADLQGILNQVVQSYIAAIGDVLLRDGDGVYNVVMPRHVSLWEYVETAMQVTGRRTEVTCHDDPEALVDNWYACRPLVEKHGVRPAVPLATGIESVLRGLSHRGQLS
jgi:hypothetical protein